MSSESRLIERRQLLQASLATGALAALPSAVRSQAAGSAGSVIARPIPSTGEALPVIGIGTNQFGRTDYGNVRSVLERMHAMGGTLIDTAAGYGASEEVIGRALDELGLQNEMFIATKFNADGVGRGGGVNGLPSFERSLERLQMDSVDLMFAHNINSVEPLMPLLMELKESGRVRYTGITTVRREQHAQVMRYMREYPMDFIQIDYSLGNRGAETDVFPLAMERGVGVMLAVPFRGENGSLFGRVSGRELPEWAAEFGATSWAQLFLKYSVSHPAVTCAIPGTDDIEHLVDNQSAGLGTLPDAAMRRRIEDYWDQMA